MKRFKYITHLQTTRLLRACWSADGYARMRLLLVSFLISLCGTLYAADEVTLTAANLQAAARGGTATYGPLSFTAQRSSGKTTPAYYENYGELRLYASNTLQVTTTSGTITQMVVMVSENGRGRLAEITADGGTIAQQSVGDETVTWTGNASSVTLTVGEKSVYGTDGDSNAGQLRIAGIVLTIEGGNPDDYKPYTLNIGTSPANAGYVSPQGTQQALVGQQVNVYTYSYNSAYLFQHWTANGSVVSTSSDFSYTMPAEDVELLAVYKYSPENPGDPQSAVSKYTLTLEAVPVNSGSFNHNNVEKIEAGTQVYLYCYNNTSYQFDHWEVDGQNVSNDRSFYYTMPEKDVTVQAVFKYNPSSPADPETPKLTYTVTLTTQPTNAGYFNWSNVTQVEASQYCNIYAYPNSGYKFREWQKDGETVSTSQRYNFDMPSEHVNLTAIFDYSPVNPGHPNSNYWNPETGEVIVDDFTTGSLYGAIYNLVGGYDNMGKVQSITVQGEVNSNDWSIARNFSNCGFIDMSRTRGLNYVPQWCFENATSLLHVALPQDIERIESYAFYGCSNLNTISCHAITPPVLDSYAFQNAPDGVVVYVPAYAVALYQEADGWKDLVASKGYIIMPFGDEVSALAVNLPDGTDLSLYKDMYIELVNIRSGQKQRYVITNRTTYTFSSLIHNTTYNVYLKNAAGKVLGEIDNVKIENQDVEVTFSDLLVPRTLTLSVKTPGGDDVTEQTTITWLDEKDAYLNKGNMLAGLLDGTKVKYRMLT